MTFYPITIQSRHFKGWYFNCDISEDDISTVIFHLKIFQLIRFIWRYFDCDISKDDISTATFQKMIFWLRHFKRWYFDCDISKDDIWTATFQKMIFWLWHFIRAKLVWADLFLRKSLCRKLPGCRLDNWKR